MSCVVAKRQSTATTRSMMQSTRRRLITARNSAATLRPLIGALAMAVLIGDALAIERVGIEVGTGDHVAVVGADFGFGEWKRASLGGGWTWSLHGQVGVAAWEGRDHDTAHKHVTDVSAYRYSGSTGMRSPPARPTSKPLSARTCCHIRGSTTAV
jgi:hypothetical protein